MTNLLICQDCKVNPATYGDGLTWSRCSQCQYKFESKNPKEEKQAPLPTGESVPHVSRENLTSIIMPVYLNSYTLFHYTGNAIGSIREHTINENDPYELIVIDNGSPIKPPSLNSYYADKVISNEKNMGVTYAWNQGIRASFGEYIVLINNDVQVFDGWLPNMKKALEKYDLVMAHPMYSNTEPFARAVESQLVLSGKKKFDPIPGGKDFSCVMFRKELLDEVGLFDEDFFNYASDSEMLDRLTKFGKKYTILNNVAIHHVSDATGFSITETPEIMNKDKETYEKKKKQVPQVEIKKEEIKPSVNNLIRTQATGDRIFYILNNKYYWIKSPQVLKELGFDFGQEKTVTREEFSKFERGGEINMENVGEFKNAKI